MHNSRNDDWQQSMARIFALESHQFIGVYGEKTVLTCQLCKKSFKLKLLSNVKMKIRRSDSKNSRWLRSPLSTAQSIISSSFWAVHDVHRRAVKTNPHAWSTSTEATKEKLKLKSNATLTIKRFHYRVSICEFKAIRVALSFHRYSVHCAFSSP